MHKDTTKIKRNNAPNNWDENLTYATPSSETTSTSSEHERVSNGHGNETGSQICHVKDLPIDFNRTSGTCQSSSVVHTWRAPEEPNLTLVLLCTRYKRSLYPAQGENGCWLECALLEINCWRCPNDQRKGWVFITLSQFCRVRPRVWICAQESY